MTDADIKASYITLRWTSPSNNGGSPVIDYRVTVSGADDKRILPPVTGTKTLIDKLQPGSSYTFILSARNIVGYSDSVSKILTTEYKGTL